MARSRAVKDKRPVAAIRAEAVKFEYQLLLRRYIWAHTPVLQTNEGEMLDIMFGPDAPAVRRCIEISNGHAAGGRESSIQKIGGVDLTCRGVPANFAYSAVYDFVGNMVEHPALRDFLQAPETKENLGLMGTAMFLNNNLDTLERALDRAPLAYTRQYLTTLPAVLRARGYIREADQTTNFKLVDPPHNYWAYDDDSLQVLKMLDDVTMKALLLGDVSGPYNDANPYAIMAYPRT